MSTHQREREVKTKGREDGQDKVIKELFYFCSTMFYKKKGELKNTK